MSPGRDTHCKGNNGTKDDMPAIAGSPLRCTPLCPRERCGTIRGNQPASQPTHQATQQPSNTPATNHRPHRPLAVARVQCAWRAGVRGDRAAPLAVVAVLAEADGAVGTAVLVVAGVGPLRPRRQGAVEGISRLGKRNGAMAMRPECERGSEDGAQGRHRRSVRRRRRHRADVAMSKR